MPDISVLCSLVELPFSLPEPSPPNFRNGLGLDPFGCLLLLRDVDCGSINHIGKVA